MTRGKSAGRTVLYVPPDIARTWRSLRREAGAPALLLDTIRQIRAEAEGNPSAVISEFTLNARPLFRTGRRDLARLDIHATTETGPAARIIENLRAAARATALSPSHIFTLAVLRIRNTETAGPPPRPAGAPAPPGAAATGDLLVTSMKAPRGHKGDGP
jgi:hypothetical protein